MDNWVQTNDGSLTAYNSDYKEHYHSQDGAYAECLHVFVKPFLTWCQANPKTHYTVLDVGFGLGLNWISLVNEALKNHVTLKIYSIEKDSHVVSQKLPEEFLPAGFSETARSLFESYRIYHRVCDQGIDSTLLITEASVALQEFQKDQSLSFDVVLQDAFSPQKNPECWDENYWQLVASNCHKGSLVLSYSVARSVCEALKGAGFRVDKKPGFGQKRHQLQAKLV